MDMRKWVSLLALMALLICLLIPSVSFTEDKDTILLARTIYALCKDESYQTKLAIGTVVMNRVENAWFADSLGEVLEQQQQFPAGNRYDAESLKAAHAVLAGTRVLDASALYYQPADAEYRWNDASLVETVGGYAFYSSNGQL